MFDGSAHYAEFRDHARSLNDRRDIISVREITDELDRLRKVYTKLIKDYDSLLHTSELSRLIGKAL
jgi:hypothetical protein